MRKRTFKSPIKERLLPLPGTGVLIGIFDKAFSTFALFCIFTVLLIQALTLWQIRLSDRVPTPWFSTTLTIVLGVYVLARFKRLPTDILERKQGRDGEIVVGRLLEGLRPFGYTPLHDIPCISEKDHVFNVDHVLVGPTGVFATETKAWSKTVGYKLTYDGRKLTHKRGVEALDEARRHAAHIGCILRDKLQDKNTWVYPVLTLPGWWIDNKSTSDPRRDNREVIVVNPKQIGAYLKDWERRLSDEQIQKIVSVLSSYVFETQDKLEQMRK